MRFGWDPAKDQANRAKHGGSFAEVIELFKAGVACTEREDDVLRILSARLATKKERQRCRKFKS
jgi:uncharacterized DUF497 family protein